jgi:predicted dehydrogenase
VNGTRAHCVIEDTVRSYSFQEAGNETREVWQAGYFNDVDREFHRTFDRHWDAVVEAFMAGGQPPIHAIAGRRALQLAYAVIQSSQTGRLVPLSE